MFLSKSTSIRLLILLAIFAVVGLLLLEVVNHNSSASRQEGKSLPQLPLTDLQGKTVNFKDHNSKVILLNFWSTTCPPCVHEMPSLDKLYKRYVGKNFVVIGLSVDHEKNDVLEFLGRVPVSFPIWLDYKTEAVQYFKIFRLPETYLIDKNGVIVEQFTGAFDWNQKVFWEKIDRLLAN